MFLRALILFYLLPSALFAQLSPEVSSVYNRLNSDVAFCETATNSAGQVSIDNKFRSLAGIASDAELYYVALSGAPALKECALAELVERKSDSLNQLFFHYIRSAERYPVAQGGKLFETTPAVQLFTRVAWQKEKRMRKEYYERTANKAEIVELKVLFGRDYSSKWSIAESDSLLSAMVTTALAFDEISAEKLNAILKTIDYKTNNYDRARFFAHKYRTVETIATLAMYKNKDDLPFLKQNLDNAYVGIAKFPHQSFMPELKSSLHNKYENPSYLDAIASYRNAEAKSILDLICQKIVTANPIGPEREEKLSQLYTIIERSNCQLYAPLLEKLQKF